MDLYSLENMISVIIFTSLVLYTITGGAEFGGGIWSLLVSPVRSKKQRALIANALTPICEANHIWLIVFIGVLFVGFPSAFVAGIKALLIPVAIMLTGFLLRGLAFLNCFFRKDQRQESGKLDILFALGSIISPFALGIILATLASGTLHFKKFSGAYQVNSVLEWLMPFPLIVGAFALAICAYLDALQLIIEADSKELKSDFRKRALAAAIIVAILAFSALCLSKQGAPLIYRGLLLENWSLTLQIGTGFLALMASIAIVMKWDYLARTFGYLQVIFIIFGWIRSQFPYLIVPDFTFANSLKTPILFSPLKVVFLVGIFILAMVIIYSYSYYKDKTETNQ